MTFVVSCVYDHDMIISEVIERLYEIRQVLGDVPVFFGSLYQDVEVQAVVVEEGYPLILASELPLL